MFESTHLSPVVLTRLTGVHQLTPILVRKAFQLARQAAPCVLFLDELDSIVTNRQTSSGSSTASVESRVLATLLTEMDGVIDASTTAQKDGMKPMMSHNSAGGVIVMGATNRLDFIDAALLRKVSIPFGCCLFMLERNESIREDFCNFFLHSVSFVVLLSILCFQGRFHHVLHIPAPDRDERLQLFQHFSAKFSVGMQEVQSYMQKLQQKQLGDQTEKLIQNPYRDFTTQEGALGNRISRPDIDEYCEGTTINHDSRYSTSSHNIGMTAEASYLLRTNTSGADIENICREIAMSKFHFDDMFTLSNNNH